MARGVNKVILVGNLGKDPEIKSTPSGMSIATFSLATTERRKDKDGNWQDQTEWHNIKAFGRTAEVVGQYLKKGSSIFVEGRIHYDSWDDKETGQKKYRTEVIVNDLIMLGGGGQREGGEGYSGGRGGASKAGNSFDQRAPGNDEAPASSGEITDEDIPF